MFDLNKDTFITSSRSKQMGPNLLMTTFWKNYGAKKEAHAEGEEFFSKNVLQHYINGNANILSED